MCTEAFGDLSNPKKNLQSVHHPITSRVSALEVLKKANASHLNAPQPRAAAAAIDKYPLARLEVRVLYKAHPTR